MLFSKHRQENLIKQQTKINPKQTTPLQKKTNPKLIHTVGN